MRVNPTSIPGAYELVLQRTDDARGRFVKLYRADAFIDAGLCPDFVEEYYTRSFKGVLRGMHCQVPPAAHAKLVHCPLGRVMDVALDLRIGSPTFGMHEVVELSDGACNAMYLPPGIAHGFYTLSDSSIVGYAVTSLYDPEHDTGVRWDSCGISWPDACPLVSPRDAALPPLDEFSSPFACEAQNG